MMSSVKGSSSSSSSSSMMLLLAVLVAAATASVDARVLQHQQEPQELQADHGSEDLSRPHLPGGFRTGFSRSLDHGPLLKESTVALRNEETSPTPVKSAKKKAYVQTKLEKESSQEQPHSRSKRFFLPKQKFRVVAVPLSVFNFLGFLPVRVPGLPFHNDLPSPELIPYRTTHEVPLRVRRKRLFRKDY